MNKRILATLLTVLLVLSACRSNDEPSPSGGDAVDQSPVIIEPESDIETDGEEDIIAQWKDTENALNAFYLADTWEEEESMVQLVEELMIATDSIDNSELRDEIIDWAWDEVVVFNRNLAGKAYNGILQWVQENYINTTGYKMNIVGISITNTHHDPEETGYHETRYTHTVTLQLNFNKEDNNGTITLMDEALEYENRLYYNEDGSPVEAPDYVTYEPFETQTSYGREFTSYAAATSIDIVESGTVFQNIYEDRGVRIVIKDDGVSLASFEGAQIADYSSDYVEVFSSLLQNLDSLIFECSPIARINVGDLGRWISARHDMSPFYTLLSRMSGTALEPATEAQSTVRLFYTDNLISISIEDGIIRLAHDLGFLPSDGYAAAGDERFEDSIMITIYPSSS